MTATILRKKHTGEATSNVGHFGTKTHTDDEVALVETVPFERPAVFTTRYDSAKERVDAFMEELGNAVEGLAEDQNYLHYLNTMSKFHRYSMNNQLLIQMQYPSATRVAGFNKWKEMGRSVKKGEKAISILAPRTISVEAKDKDGNLIYGENGKPVKRPQVVGVTPVPVFDISQTEGEDLPDVMTISEEPPAGLIDDLEGAVAAAGFTLSYSNDMPAGTRGYTTTDGSKQIVLRDNLSEGMKARVLAHELGHVAAGHLDRHDEYHQGHGGQRGQMEIEADSIAYVMLRSNGMSTDAGTASAAYVRGWGAKNPGQLKECAETVSKAVKHLLGASPFRNVLSA